MSLLVVNLGLPKSGTTTLARALRRAGLTTADHRLRSRQVRDPALHDAPVAELLYRGYFESGDPLAHLAGFQALSEISLLQGGRSIWPQTDWGLIAAIRAHHPGVRFLASERDPRDQALSMLRWSDMGTRRLPEADVPGLPRGHGEITSERIRWIEGHRAFLRQVFAGSDDFLAFDIADPQARKRIAAHIGTPLPWWGRANVNSFPRPLERL